jgi:arabinoxylan arabinofuranohydrolase
VDVLINGTSDKKFTLIIYGDTNSDGSVNIADLTAIKGHILKISSLEGVDFIAADMFKKGRISINDVLQVKKVLLGLT